MLTPWKESYDQPRHHIQKQRQYFANKGPSSQGYGFSSGHLSMWELDCEESWAPKNWCFWTVVLEKTLESSLDCKEIKPVDPKVNQSWIFIGRTDVEAETPIFGHLMWRTLMWKYPDAGKVWGQEKKGTTEDEVVRWHHRLDEHEFEQVPGVGDGQGSLVCCSPWGCKESDTTEWLNWTHAESCESPNLEVIFGNSHTTRMFIGTLNDNKKLEEKFKCLSTSEWINNNAFIHWMYIAMKKNQLILSTIIWMNLIDTMLSERN